MTKNEVDATKVTDLLQPGDARLPFGVMDSDAAVSAAKAALGKEYDVSKTTDPAIRLEFDRDGSGPWWLYVVQTSDTKLISTRVHALTGETEVELH